MPVLPQRLWQQSSQPTVVLGLPAALNPAGLSGTPAAGPQVSKYAVRGMTAQVAAELGDFGIRANCVAPGAVDTVSCISILLSARLRSWLCLLSVGSCDLGRHTGIDATAPRGRPGRPSWARALDPACCFPLLAACTMLLRTTESAHHPFASTMQPLVMG